MGMNLLHIAPLSKLIILLVAGHKLQCTCIVSESATMVGVRGRSISGTEMDACGGAVSHLCHCPSFLCCWLVWLHCDLILPFHTTDMADAGLIWEWCEQKTLCKLRNVKGFITITSVLLLQRRLQCGVRRVTRHASIRQAQEWLHRWEGQPDGISQDSSLKVIHHQHLKFVRWEKKCRS